MWQQQPGHQSDHHRVELTSELTLAHSGSLWLHYRQLPAAPALPRPGNSILCSHRTQLREPRLGSAPPPSSHWSTELYQPFIEHFYGNCVFTSSFIHQQNCVRTSIGISFITNHPHSMIKQKEEEYLYSVY